jgi:hypothetical protein
VRDVRGDVTLLTRATTALYEDDGGRVGICIEDLADEFLRLGLRL